MQSGGGRDGAAVALGFSLRPACHPCLRSRAVGKSSMRGRARASNGRHAMVVVFARIEILRRRAARSPQNDKKWGSLKRKDRKVARTTSIAQFGFEPIRDEHLQ